MSDDQAICEANYQRFLHEVIASETVWALSNGNDFACCESNDPDPDGDGNPEDTTRREEEEAGDVLVFWSDLKGATKVQKTQFPDYQPESIPLFDYLYSWLPHMTDDSVYVGTNWTDELLGFEILPDELQEELIAAMPDALREQYQARLDQLLDEEGADAPEP